MAAEDPRCFEKTEAECRGSKTCTWLSLIDKTGDETGEGVCVSNGVAKGDAKGRKPGTVWGYYNEYTEEAKKEIDAWEPRSSISSGETTGFTIAQRKGLFESRIKSKASPTKEQIERKKELDGVIEERKERLLEELEEAKDDNAIREIVQRELGVDGGIMSGITNGLSNLFSIAVGTGSAIASGASGAGSAIASGASGAGSAIASGASGAGSALASRTAGIGSVLASGASGAGSTIASGAAGAGSALASGTSTLINSIMNLKTHEMLEAIIIITRLNTNPDIKKILYGNGTVIYKLNILLDVSEDNNVKKDIKRLKKIFTNMTGGNSYEALYLKYKAKYLKLKKELEI